VSISSQPKTKRRLASSMQQDSFAQGVQKRSGLNNCDLSHFAVGGDAEENAEILKS
jgi:hypothetical protein